MTKKIIIGVAILLLVAIALICWMLYSSDKPTSYVIDGENFSAEVKNGSELMLNLPSNATTGYSWVIIQEPDIFKSDYNTYIAPDNKEDLVGIGGGTEFHITALDSGVGTMVFQYKQDWVGGEIAETYELNLEISKHQNTYQIDTVTFVEVD